jgi:hypothetical protein
METADIVRAIMGNAPLEDVQQYVNDILAVKAQDAMDVKKVELASNLIDNETEELSPEKETETNDEVSNDKNESDGEAEPSDDDSDE